MQSLLVVDEAKVSWLTDESSRMARLHTGLALLRDQQPEGVERGPGRGGRHIGCPDESCGVGKRHKEWTCNDSATSGPLSGEVGGDEGRLWGTEVLEGEKVKLTSLWAIEYVRQNVYKDSFLCVFYKLIFFREDFLHTEKVFFFCL